MANNVASDFNLQKLNTKELSENLRATVEYGGNVFVAARRGSGKTFIAKDVIRDSGCLELYQNVSTHERTDAAGYPLLFNANKDAKYVNYLLPYYYEMLIEGDRPVVALLDEVDKADHDIFASLLEFTQFHTVNGRKLPNLKAVIMTGNLASEGGARPALPLLDRAEKYLVEASHTHWLDWASKTGEIHPSITAYIADHPEDLFGDVDPGELYADPSPRGWHNASKIISFGEKQRWSNRVLTNKVAGSIGKKVGIKYASYFDHYQVLLPIIDKIIKGESVEGFDRLEQSKQMVACMIVCARLARALDDIKGSDKELPAMTKPIAKFLTNVDPEMGLISFRSQIGLDRTVQSGIDEDPSFDPILRSMAQRING